MSLAGQSISQYQGTNSGTIVIDIEECVDRYKGVACVWDDNLQHPSSLVRFITTSKDRAQTISNVKIVPMQRTGRYLEHDELDKLSKQAFRSQVTRRFLSRLRDHS